jgi:hypothetical protein
MPKRHAKSSPHTWRQWARKMSRLLAASTARGKRELANPQPRRSPPQTWEECITRLAEEQNVGGENAAE